MKYYIGMLVGWLFCGFICATITHEGVDKLNAVIDEQRTKIEQLEAYNARLEYHTAEELMNVCMFKMDDYNSDAYSVRYMECEALVAEWMTEIANAE